MTTPVSERSTSAAKSRGMLSRNCDSRRRKARPDIAAGGAGGELGDDRGDQRQAAGDPEARQEDRAARSGVLR